MNWKKEESPVTSFFNRKKIFKMLLLNLFLPIILLYILICLYMFIFQEKFVFAPNKILSSTPESLGLEYEDLYLKSLDGITINAWFIPFKNADYTILLSHGNAGNISGEIDVIKFSQELKMNILLYDYRGYGNSQGQMSEKGSYKDLITAYNYLIKDKKVNNKNIIIYGRSLGGAVSIGANREIQPAAYIIDSTFTSIIEMGKQKYPFLPIGYLSRIYYDNLTKIKEISEPILIIHSKEDEVIPYEFAKKLYSNANSPKEFLDIMGLHYYGFYNNELKYKQGIRNFLLKYILSN